MTHPLFARDRYRKDVQHGHLWDSIVIQPERRLRGVKLFHCPIGNTDPYDDHVKTLADTNLSMWGRLPMPEEFLVKRLIFTFSKAAADPDVYNVAESAVYRFILGQKIYLTSHLISLNQAAAEVAAPFHRCDFCHSLFVQRTECPGCGARQFTLTTLGSSAEVGRQFYQDIAYPLWIGEQEDFYMGFEESAAPPLSGPVKMWVHLEGDHARGIQ